MQLILVLILTTAVLFAPAQSVPSDNRLGIHMLLDDGRNRWPTEDWPDHMAYARQVVGEWGSVTQVIRSNDLDPGRWQIFMKLCAELHLQPIVRLATVFDSNAGWWEAPPQDADGRYTGIAEQFAAFIIALDWPTESHYVIVGNEPNHGNEWGGTPDGGAYAHFLRDVAVAIHAVDSHAVVMNGGLDHYAPHTGDGELGGGHYMDAESFMDAMVQAVPDVFSHIDAWASHPYPMGAFAEPPWRQEFKIDLLNGAMNPDHLEPLPGMVNRGINAYEWELYKLASYGVEDLSIFITETGWRHAETTYPDSIDNGREWPDAETVAIYIDLALHGNNGRYPDLPEDGWRPWLDDERVQSVVFFALNGSPHEWGHTNWLQMAPDGTVRGTYPHFDLLAGR